MTRLRLVQSLALELVKGFFGKGRLDTNSTRMRLKLLSKPKLRRGMRTCQLENCLTQNILSFFKRFFDQSTFTFQKIASSTLFITWSAQHSLHHYVMQQQITLIGRFWLETILFSVWAGSCLSGHTGCCHCTVLGHVSWGGVSEH